MSILFSPLKIKEVTLRNRVIVPPMCQYSASNGYSSDWHFVHYGSIASGGAGAVIVEATAVSPEGRITPYDLGLWEDGQIEGLAKIFHYIEKQGAVPALQIAHSGRKGCTDKPWLGGKPVDVENGGWSPIYAPSPIPFDSGYQIPTELTKDHIYMLAAAFKSAASRALLAGCKIIEIHSAHGYLLHEFLSPISNKRSDEFGGCLKNRSRFLLEVVRGVRQVWHESLPIFVRISATDWIEGGFNIDEAVEVAEMLKNEGVDFIDCSTAGLAPYAKIPVAPMFQVPFAKEIKSRSGMLVSAVGMITEAEQAEAVVSNGYVDAVMVGRGILHNHQWVLHTAQKLKGKVDIPNQYLRAY